MTKKSKPSLGDVAALKLEERHQFFQALFRSSPTVLNALNPEERRQAYAVLIALDPTLNPPDPRSAIRGIPNEQVLINFMLVSLLNLIIFLFREKFARGSEANPIKRTEYKVAQSAKDFRWDEFLGLDHEAYLNFRVSFKEIFRFYLLLIIFFRRIFGIAPMPTSRAGSH
jgi:hypothetical protein